MCSTTTICCFQNRWPSWISGWSNKVGNSERGWTPEASGKWFCWFAAASEIISKNVYWVVGLFTSFSFLSCCKNSPCIIIRALFCEQVLLSVGPKKRAILTTSSKKVDTTPASNHDETERPKGLSCRPPRPPLGEVQNNLVQPCTPKKLGGYLCQHPDVKKLHVSDTSDKENQPCTPGLLTAAHWYRLMCSIKKPWMHQALHFQTWWTWSSEGLSLWS